ncbi:hypothetical protein WJT86_04725 [Microvirga sp. W0021]|uniref:Lipoprotein n=1 Tax=Hohaiivirga grylli TaxID=3133970 RepID=A0ABV0BJP5_9HYPH
MKKLIALAGLSLLVAACSSAEEGTNTASNLFFFNKTEAPEVAKPPTETIYCPRVDVYEGGGYTTTNAGGQASIIDTARECHLREDGSVRVKVGVAGRVVLASGSSGRYSVPVHYRIKVGDRVLAQRSQTATALVGSERRSGEFASVQEGFIVPAAHLDTFTIEVGIGGRR